jgi:hypothetical protein
MNNLDSLIWFFLFSYLILCIAYFTLKIRSQQDVSIPLLNNYFSSSVKNVTPILNNTVQDVRDKLKQLLVKTSLRQD